MDKPIDKEVYTHVTLESFLHGVDFNVLDPIACLKDLGGDLEVSSNGTSHARFEGKLQISDAELVLNWAKSVTMQASAGRVVILVGKSEPNEFEWHDLGVDRQSWQQGFNEYVSLFGSKITHIIKR